MKIYFPVLCYFPSQAGGPANTIFWLNEELARVGCSCSVTSTFFGLNNSEEINFQLYHPLNSVRFVKRISGFFRLSEVKRIVSCDIIHFSSLFFKPTFFFIVLAFLLKKEIVLSPRGELYPDALQKSSKKKSFFLFILQFFSKYIRFHATNEIEKGLIEFHFPKNKGITIIPNYIPVEDLRRVNQKYQILFLGRINEIKNVHVIIQALENLKNNLVSSPKLVIAGKAELESEKKYLNHLKNEILQRGLENDIEFVGQVSGEQKLILIQESLCTILPSKSENFGNVVLESLMMGTPVIASKGTPWNILNQKNAGYWIDADPIEISDRITKIIQMSKSEYLQMRNNSRSFVLDEFDIKKNINKWLEFYN
jgi:glycosyltransferase involved in cell wall biosynthesis